MANRNAVQRKTERLASVVLGAALALFAACSMAPRSIEEGTPLPSEPAAAGGGPEEIVVTGSRVERNVGTLERSTVERRLSQAAVPMAAARAEPAGRPFAGMRAAARRCCRRCSRARSFG